MSPYVYKFVLNNYYRFFFPYRKRKEGQKFK